jgi:hypothetical protein
VILGFTILQISDAGKKTHAHDMSRLIGSPGASTIFPDANFPSNKNRYEFRNETGWIDTEFMEARSTYYL